MSSQYPLVSVLGTILAWQHEPTPERLDRVGLALGRLIAVETTEVRGVYLAAAPDVVRGLSVGWGSLVGGGPPQRPPIEILDGDTECVMGRLWLEPAVPPSDEALHAIQLALQAARSNTEQRRS